MSASQRRKGIRWEQQLARRLQRWWPGARRGYQARDGTEAPDITGTPYHWEAKHERRPSPRAALRQAEDASRGLPAIAVCKDHRAAQGREIVAMRWSTLVGLLDRSKTEL